jgi:hypothetical protein
MLRSLAHRLPLVSLLITLAACSSSETSVTLGADTGTSPDGSQADTSVAESGGDAGPDGQADATSADAADAGETGSVTPPPPPSDAGTPADAGGTGTTKWFVINAMKLGLTPRDSTAKSVNAWKDYGYDLDGRTTTADDSKNGTNTCTRVTGAPSGMLTDGNLGRDNNFGGHIMQTISQLQAGAEDSFNKSIADGGTTMLLRLDNVGAADNANVPGAIYVTAPMPTGTTPKFDGTDAYTVLTTSLADGTTIANAKVKFTHGYMAGGVWVSGVPSSSEVANLPLPTFGWIETPVTSPIFSVNVADGTNGTIAGAIGVSDFQAALGPWARSFGICPGSSTYQQVIQTFTMSADLSLGHPQLQNVGATCDAISMGIGFTLKPIPAPLAKAAPTPPGADPCGDAGV